MLVKFWPIILNDRLLLKIEIQRNKNPFIKLRSFKEMKNILLCVKTALSYRHQSESTKKCFALSISTLGGNLTWRSSWRPWSTRSCWTVSESPESERVLGKSEWWNPPDELSTEPRPERLSFGIRVSSPAILNTKSPSLLRGLKVNWLLLKNFQ